DKHHCKVKEPEFLIAAVDRGKNVIVSKDITFAVTNHNSTKTGIIPNIAMIYNISDSINSDFYTRKMHIGLKDLIFQLSLLISYATELYYILLDEQFVEKP
ncbi:17688_t:CDS:1, partial [Funneliformis geosporum]